MRKLKIKLAHWLLKDAYKFPTVDEIVTVNQEGDIFLGERMVDRGDVNYFGKHLQELTDNDVLTHVMNAVLFKWQSNIISDGEEKDLRIIREVSKLYSDTEQIIQDVNKRFSQHLRPIDKVD